MSYNKILIFALINFLLLGTISGQMAKHIKIGDLEVYQLIDGDTYLNMSDLAGIDHNLATKLTGVSDSINVPINAFLIRMPGHVVLVDTGAGNDAGENTGHLSEQIKNSGVTPQQVDIVLITHFHFDHIGGLTTVDGKRVFPNATIYVSKAESDYWLRDLNLIPENQRTRAKKYLNILSPYIDANKYHPFSPDERIIKGIEEIPAYGHTIGHTVYSFSSNGHELLCIGDIIHFEKVQFGHPSACVSFDYNLQMAGNSRIIILDRAVKDKAIVAGSHIRELIEVLKDGDVYKSISVNEN